MISKKKCNVSLFFIFVLLILIVYAIVLLIPLFWALLTSLKSRADFVENTFGFPKKMIWENYTNAFEYFFVSVKTAASIRPRNVYLFEMLAYSLGYSIFNSLSPLISTLLVAYAVVRFDRKFNEILTGIVIVTMCVPIIGSLASSLQILKDLQLYDTFYGPIITGFSFLGGNFLILRAALRVVPKSFTEAAIMDGASELRILISIVIPMIKTTLLILFLTGFIGRWNDYSTPLMVMPSYPTLAFGLYTYNNSNSSNSLSSVPMKITGCMYLMVPIFVLFMIFKNKMIGNLSMGGLKE